MGQTQGNGKVRQIPFVFNNSQTYNLVFGNLSMRVIKNGLMLFDPSLSKTITGITNANPAVVTTSAAHGYTTGMEVTISEVVGLNEPGTGLPTLSSRTFSSVTVLSSTTFSIPVSTIGLSAYVSGGGTASPYQIATPYAVADLPALKYTQSADVVTIAHPSYPPQELERTGDTAWSFANESGGSFPGISFVPTIAAPTGLTIGGGSAGSDTFYVATAVAADGEESAPSAALGYLGEATALVPFSIDTISAPGSVSVNIYKNSNGIYGFIGSTITDNFTDRGYTPDYTLQPPTLTNPFNGTNNYPSAVAYFQQRQFFANLNSNPEGVYGSRSASYLNFDVRIPTQDDDAVTFTLIGSGRANPVEHLLSLRTFLILTSGGEWAANGDGNGVITPSEVNLVQYSFNGSSSLPPIVIGSDALYVQARGSIVRDLAFDFLTDTYKGNDLTIFSNHLVDGYTLVDWTYAQIPESTVWMARSDGTLLGLTYIKEQEILAWHRHDFEDGDAVVEGVCAIPEGTEDALYVVINRTVNGQSVRYIERLGSRLVTPTTDLTEYVGMDCSFFQDGRNIDAGTMTLSGGTTWGYQETLTLTSSVSNLFSKANDVIILEGSDGSTVRFQGAALISGSVLHGSVTKTVPASLRGIAASHWSAASNTVNGLWALEGKAVSVFADGFVVASPNNEAYDTITVTNGTITLPDSYAYIRVGLPITCDIETLDIDTQQGETPADKKKNISALTIWVENSRGIWAGVNPANDPDWDGADLLDGLVEAKVRDNEDPDEPVALSTGTIDMVLQSEWNSNGRIFIRQVDPVPLSVLAVAPRGLIPIQGRY